MSRSIRSRRGALKAPVALLLSLSLAAAAAAAPASDSGFGKVGIAVAPMPAAEREAIAESGQGPLISALATVPGGGFAAAVGSGAEVPYFGAAGFGPRGAPARRFGGDGFVQVEEFFPGVGFGFPGPGYEPEAEGVAVQRDGKVVLVGYRTGGSFDKPGPVAIRLRADGRPDPGFGRRGLVAPKPGKAPPDALRAVAVRRDGVIVAVGVRNEKRIGGGLAAGLVVAYRRDGSLDRSFGTRGRVLFSGRKGGGYTGLFDVAALPGGKVLVAGYRDDELFVARLRADGRPDRSFGKGGSVSIDIGLNGCCPVAASVAPLPGGGSIVAGDGYGPVLMARLRADGRLDRGFGRGGLVRRGSPARTPEVHDLAVQGKGRIVLVGVGSHQGRLDFTTLRFRSDGRPDRGFGSHGVEVLPLGRASFGTSAARLPNGRVVVGGGAQYRRNGHFEYSLVLAKLQP